MAGKGGRKSGFEHALDEGHPGIDVVVPREVEDPLTRCFTHGGFFLRIERECTLDDRDELLWILRLGDEEPGLARGNELMGAVPDRNETGQPRGHRLEHGVRAGVVSGRVEEEVRCLVKRCRILSKAEVEDPLVDPASFNLFQVAAAETAADDPEVGVDVPPCPKNGFEAFSSMAERDDKKDGDFWVSPKLRANFFAYSSRGIGVEALAVDCGMDDRDPLGGDLVGVSDLVSHHLRVADEVTGSSRGVESTFECQFGAVLRTESSGQWQHVVRIHFMTPAAGTVDVVGGGSTEADTDVGLELPDGFGSTAVKASQP